MTARTLPIPEFFSPVNAEAYAYSPDVGWLLGRAEQFRSEHRIEPAASDRRSMHLLLIDAQRDFCFREGALFVAGRSGRGALDDNRRTAEFIYRNLARLTTITATMDTHFAFQIFFPSFWIDRDGRAPKPHREITSVDLERGELRPNPRLAPSLAGGDYAWLEKQVRHYCEALEEAGKHRLYLWPPHCLLGSDGHALAGVIHEARLFHSFVRSAVAITETKGDHALTENYSVLRPEVLSRHDGGTLATKNHALIDRLLESDALVVAGQAKSHCVRSTIADLWDEIRGRDPRLARKVFILEDCMSAVTVAGEDGTLSVDFTDDARRAFDAFRDAGMNVVQSTDDVDAWRF